ncbi:MAG TPA: hypothetical protein VGI65_06760 [Steroidobacteraceae bacterium]|jgi:hypothetical protein
MVARARRAREVFRFIRINSPAYLRVFHSDLRTFREELIRTSVGLVIGAVAGLLFVSFLSVALLVSAWDTKFRLLTAWGVSVGWLVIAIIGLIVARQALKVPLPFANFTQLLQQDLAAIERVEP